MIVFTLHRAVLKIAKIVVLRAIFNSFSKLTYFAYLINNISEYFIGVVQTILFAFQLLDCSYRYKDLLYLILSSIDLTLN